MRKIVESVWWCGSQDWDRRLFDALMPLPAGTSYNAYLIKGTEKTALLDAVDETQKDALFEQLASVPAVDYIVAHHAEQDHSGALPELLARYPQARVMAGNQGRNFLLDLLHLPPERVAAVKDGELLPLGGKTLRFLMVPWVHWPDTMASFLEEDRILFSCDFFGSHLATSALYASAEPRTLEAARQYYAQIMMPYSKLAAKNVEKIAPLAPALIAPSHGPIHDKPDTIVSAWREWTSAPPRNAAVLAYVSMHGSTRRMADRLAGALVERGVRVDRFDLTAADPGRLASALVDAATLLLGTPATLNGPHPLAAQAAFLVNALKPKLRHAAVFGSYGWGAKALEGVGALMPDLALDYLPPVLCKGAPRDSDLQALDALASAVAEKHASFESDRERSS